MFFISISFEKTLDTLSSTILKAFKPSDTLLPGARVEKAGPPLIRAGVDVRALAKKEPGHGGVPGRAGDDQRGPPKSQSVCI